MAKLFPSRPIADTPNSELKVFRRLQLLDDKWTVLHSVKWQSKRNGKQSDGQADFVLIHPDSGLLVLEVKGGGVSVEDGRWATIDRRGRRFEIKDPFRQAVASKYALLSYLRGQEIDTSEVPVAFPDVIMNVRLGPAAPSEIVWDKKALIAPAEAIARTLKHWGHACHLATTTVQRIIDLLAPTVIIRRRLGEEVSEATELLTELTAQQIWLFSQLRSTRNALVLGGAGTGKTILAVERARRLATDGFVTLLVCYNELLGNHLGGQVEGNQLISASTYHGLCLSAARRAGVPLPPQFTHEWWERDAPEVLVQAMSACNESFDAVIVDEGQDFTDAWFNSLARLTSRKDSPFYIFADSHQQLYREIWKGPTNRPCLELDLNCRNTIQIASRVSAIFQEKAKIRGGAGPPPKFYEVQTDREAVKFVQRFAAKLLVGGRLKTGQWWSIQNQRLS